MEFDDRFTQAVRREQRQGRAFHRRVLRKLSQFVPSTIRSVLLEKKPSRISMLLNEFAKEQDGVNFIQIGSCDGVTGDPIHQFVLNKGWRGIVVEPVPKNFKKLQDAYKGISGVECLQAAIGTESGSKIFYHCRRDSDELPIWFDQIGSFNRDHLLKHKILHPDVENYIIETEVACMSLKDLIERSGFDRVDMLHTDVEGFDYEILKQIDFTQTKPKIILFEDFHMSDSDRKSAHAMLQAQGYELTSGEMDMLARLRPTV